jgi:hypothetical protein
MTTSKGLQQQQQQHQQWQQHHNGQLGAKTHSIKFVLFE